MRRTVQQLASDCNRDFLLLVQCACLENSKEDLEFCATLHPPPADKVFNNFGIDLQQIYYLLLIKTGTQFFLLVIVLVMLLSFSSSSSSSSFSSSFFFFELQSGISENWKNRNNKKKIGVVGRRLYWETSKRCAQTRERTLQQAQRWSRRFDCHAR